MTDYVGVYKLDARPDRIDLRDRPYTPPPKSLFPEFPPADYVSSFFPSYLNLVLNQGKQGACTGFGLACTINYLLWRQAVVEKANSSKRKMPDPPPRVSHRMLYHLARFYDEWPGEDYEGSSCRGAVKAWHKHGVCRLDLWPYTDKGGKEGQGKARDGWEKDAAERPLGVYYRIDKNSLTDMQAAIQEVGAVYVSAQVHAGWNLKASGEKTVSHTTLPRIPWKENHQQQGGHAFALVGFNRRGFIVQNSWGKEWGLRGFAVLAYDDWVANGGDAWVCVMGAPTETAVKSYFMSAATDREQIATFDLFRGQKAKCRQIINPAVASWDEEKAYHHSVVMGNDGKVINRLVIRDGAADAVRDIVFARPSAWFSQQHSREKHLVLYAHGGLNSERTSIRRIQTLAPYFKENGVYPVFMTWRTGLLESVISIMEDAVGRLFPQYKGLEDVLEKAKDKGAEILDRTLEVACENLGVKAIWSQMKQNAAAAVLNEDDRGCHLMVRELIKLQHGQQDRVNIHLVGHSAGAIFLGHMLQECRKSGLQIASCTLYAAACTVDFANTHYAAAIKNGVLDKKKFYLHLLSDTQERNDTVGPYRKSLLYLVSRALENWHKTPLLGMANVFDASQSDTGIWNKNTLAGLRSWQEFWNRQPLETIDEEQVATAVEWKNGKVLREIAKIDAAHGSFDNDVRVVDQTIRRITGGPLKHSVENLRY